MPSTRRVTRLLALIAGCLLAVAGTHAASGTLPGELLALTDPGASHPAGRNLAYFDDSAMACNAACARDRFARGDARRSNTDTPSFGLTGSYWFALDVRNDTPARDWIAQISAPFLDNVDLYVVRDGLVSAPLHTGDWIPMSRRPLHDRNLAFPLELAPGDQATLLFRVTNQGPVIFPLDLQTVHTFEHESAQENLAYGIYFGILVAIILYNLLIFLIMRDRTQMLYVIYAITFAVCMSNVFGFSNVFIWPESTWWGNRSVPLFALVTALTAILFARSFLAIPRNDPRDRFLLLMILVLSALVPAALLLPFATAVRIIYVTDIFIVLAMFTLGTEQVLRGNQSARYFMLAWAILMLALAIFLLAHLAVLPTVAFTEFGILVGSALETLLLSIAMAHRFVIIRDESARLQAHTNAELERRVEERTHALDQALQARSEFLATVSHEIRTPMNGVLGITELMLDTDLSPRQKEYAQIIQSSGRTLLTIINDVLDYSKIEAGKMSLEHVPFRVLELLNGAVQIFRAEAERKKLRFVTAIDPDVPPEIMGDPVRLQQVLSNLLSNAIKFTDDGEIRLTVHREDDGKLTFSVTDTGIGIDADIQPHLFEAFNQGDRSMTRRFGGTGLGLAISRRLVDLMGGSISFESDLGRGTTFYFTVPVQPVGSGTWRTINAESRARGEALTLLVVDDNAVNLQVAAGLLTRLGHVVTTVGNAPDAITRMFAPDARFDIVFMDCEMPGMDGYAATREIRRREQQEGRRHTPVIALTAHAFAEKIDACREAGMDDHLAKPLNLKVLEQTLARFAQDRPAKPAL